MHHWVGCRAGIDALLMFPFPIGAGTIQDRLASAYGGTLTYALGTR